MGVPEGLRDKGLRSVAARCFLAELLGTFVLVAFGDGSVAQAVTTGCGSKWAKFGSNRIRFYAKDK